MVTIPEPSPVAQVQKNKPTVPRRRTASPLQHGKATFGRLRWADVPPEAQTRINKEIVRIKKYRQDNGLPPLGAIFGRVIFGDGSPVHGGRDVALNLHEPGSRWPVEVFPGGWFHCSPSFLVEGAELRVRAFEYYPMDVPLESIGDDTGCEIEMERVKDAEMGQVHVKVVDEDGRPLPSANVSFTPDTSGSVGAGGRPEKQGKTDAKGFCVFSVPPAAECECSATTPGYIRAYATGLTVGAGESIEAELKLFRQRNFVVRLAYVFQPDGSRDLASSDCQRGTPTLSSGVFRKNSIRFALPTDNRDKYSNADDLYLSQVADEAFFGFAYGNGNGLLDAGDVELDSIVEARKDGYLCGQMACKPGHVYVLKTLEGRYAKFLVKSVKEGPPVQGVRKTPRRPTR